MLRNGTRNETIVENRISCQRNNEYNDKFLVTFAEDDGTDVFLVSRTKDYTAKVS